MYGMKRSNVLSSKKVNSKLSSPDSKKDNSENKEPKY